MLIPPATRRSPSAAILARPLYCLTHGYCSRSVAILRRARSVLATRPRRCGVESRVGAAAGRGADGLNANGRVVVTGMASPATSDARLPRRSPLLVLSLFVHPAEASHGDMGMITADDVVIALSNSGEVVEVNALLTPIKRVGAGSSPSPATKIPRSATRPISRWMPVSAPKPVRWAWHLPPAPQPAMALGDALAMALLERADRGTSRVRIQVARSDGACSLMSRDVMRTGSAIPTVAADATVAQHCSRSLAKAWA